MLLSKEVCMSLLVQMTMLLYYCCQHWLCSKLALFSGVELESPRCHWLLCFDSDCHRVLNARMLASLGCSKRLLWVSKAVPNKKTCKNKTLFRKPYVRGVGWLATVGTLDAFSCFLVNCLALFFSSRTLCWGYASEIVNVSVPTEANKLHDHFCHLLNLHYHGSHSKAIAEFQD